MALIGVAVIAMLASVAAFAVDLGTAYLAKGTNQRVADGAAYSGALAYNATASLATMNSAVSNLVALNGLAANAASANLVVSPSGDGNQAVQVVVTTAEPLYMARIFQSGTTLSVSATSYAEVTPNASACIIALLTKAAGVTLSGGTEVTAPNCAVASNNTVTVPCGTTITTKTLDYNSGAAPVQCASPASIRPPAGTASVTIVKVATVDPLATNAAVAAAFTHLAGVTSLTAPIGPAAPVVAVGGDLSFGYTNDPAQPPRSVLTAVGCTGGYSGSTWTVTCPSGGTYHFNNLTIGGGISLNFAVGGSATNTYDFSGTITVTGNGAAFGPGTYNVAGDIDSSGSTFATFGNGTTTSTFNVGGAINISGSGASFPNGTYYVTKGILTGGGSNTTFGAGPIK
jgi:hypothetical protein